MRFLRQSTASQEILVGPIVVAATGAADTGATIANTDIKLCKGGGTTESNKNSGGGTHIAGGRYSAVLDATDTDTVGILEVSANIASAIPWNRGYYVLEEAVYDALFAASATGIPALPLGAVPSYGIVENGTLQSATSSTAVLRSATSIADDLINNAQLEITGGTGAGQQRVITDWVSSTDTATVSPNWTTTPDNTSTYIVRAMAPAPTAAGSLPSVNVGEWLGTTVATPSVAGVPEVDVTHAAGSAQASIATQASVNTIDGIVDDILLDTAEIGAAGAGLTNINLPNQTMDIVGNITGNLSGSVGSVTGAVGSVTGNVGGNVTGSVGSVVGAVGSVTGSVGSVVGAVGSVTGNVGGNVVGSTASVTAGVTVTTNNDKTGYRLSATGVDDIHDEVNEGSTTFRQTQRLTNSALGAKASGLDTTSAAFRDLADTKNRIAATVDASGNRTAVTLDLT
jgi:hypothetical protein